MGVSNTGLWTSGSTQSLNLLVRPKISHTLFLQSATLLSSAGQWNLCTESKGNGQSVSCSFKVPNDPALWVTTLGIKVDWADCIDGWALGPLFCGRQGSEMSPQIRVVSGLNPEQETSTRVATTTMAAVSTTLVSSTTVPLTTIATQTTLTTSSATSSPTPTVTSISSRSSASSESSTNLGFIIGGIVASLFFLLTVGFLYWYTRTSKSSRDQDFPSGGFDHASSALPFYPKETPMAQSPFESRPGDPFAYAYDQNEMTGNEMSMDQSLQAQWNEQSHIVNQSHGGYAAQEWIAPAPTSESYEDSLPLGYGRDLAWGNQAYLPAHLGEPALSMPPLSQEPRRDM